MMKFDFQNSSRIQNLLKPLLTIFYSFFPLSQDPCNSILPASVPFITLPFLSSGTVQTHSDSAFPLLRPFSDLPFHSKPESSQLSQGSSSIWSLRLSRPHKPPKQILHSSLCLPQFLCPNAIPPDVHTRNSLSSLKPILRYPLADFMAISSKI